MMPIRKKASVNSTISDLFPLALSYATHFEPYSPNKTRIEADHDPIVQPEPDEAAGVARLEGSPCEMTAVAGLH